MKNYINVQEHVLELCRDVHSMRHSLDNEDKISTSLTPNLFTSLNRVQSVDQTLVRP